MDGQTLTAAALAGVALVVIGVVAWALRGRWDLVLEHSRDAVRHLLAALLMAGTLAGTVWTFSAGRLSIAGIWESLVSVGGIAGALECGVIYTGWYLGQLDQRIQTAKKADVRAQLTEQRAQLQRWFYAIVAISATANFAFRIQQLHNWFYAGIASVAPIVLIVLFTIVLRPLPRDYAEIGRQSFQRGLVMLATQSQHVMMRSLRKIGRGHTLSPEEMSQLAMVVTFQRAFATGEQAQALDHMISQQTQATPLLDAPTSSGAGQWLGSADVSRLYDISERTAQVWIAQTPGRRQRAHSKALEAPAAAIYAAHGVPTSAIPAQTGSGSARRRKRNEAPVAAEETQGAAEETPPGVVDALPSVGELQLAVLETPQGAAQPQRLEV